MKLVTSAFLATTALALVFPVASATANSTLQALIDGREARQSEDSRRLEQLNALNEEQASLENAVGELSQEAVSATEQFNQAHADLQQAARELQNQLQQLRDNPDQVDSDSVKAIDEASGNFRELADQVVDLSREIAAAGGADSFDSALNARTFLGDLMVLIGQESSIAFAAIELATQDELSESSVEINGTLEERLGDIDNSIDNLIEEASGLAELAPDLDGFRRLEELRDGEDERQNEAGEIDERQNFAGNGGDVLQAFGERLNGSVGDGDLVGDEEAGRRVQELAEGLAGAGQRVNEIEQEQQQIAEDSDELRDQIQDIQNRENDIELALDDREGQQEDLENLENALDQIDEAIQLNKDEGQDATVEELESIREEVQAKLDGINDVLDREEPLSDEERDALEQELAELQEEREGLVDELKDKIEQGEELQEEKDQIAGLQGELADLIRNGAPLGDAEGVDELDQFLEGAEDDASDGQVDAATEEAVDEAADGDPLSLDQFGFDADQGSTEDITGFSGNGGLNLIPCPPGSNALPVGTLVSDTAFCFT